MSPPPANNYNTAKDQHHLEWVKMHKVKYRDLESVCPFFVNAII